MNEDRELTRRELLYRAAAGSALTVGAGLLISGCKKSDEAAASGGGGEAEGGGGGGGANCDDLSGLTDAEKKTREQLKYTHESPKPEQTCANCSLWEDPKGDEYCGGCKVVKGPIDPKGWCTAWAPKA